MRDACSSFEHLIARDADAAPLSVDERRTLQAHLTDCDGCRGALDQQREVARVLRARVEAPVRNGFAARLSARLDREDAGMLGLANWRAWTVGLAPVAAALVLAAYIGVGARAVDSATPVTTASNVGASPFDNWTASAAGSSTASVFLQPSASGEVLLETVLTGSVPVTASEGSNVR